MKKSIQEISINELRERITAIRRIDLKEADIDFLKERLEFLTGGFSKSCPVPHAGLRLYRGVPWASKPTKICDLHHPPIERVTTYGRANRPQIPLFYCSTGYPGPFVEIDIKPGGFIALSIWETKEKIFLNSAGDKDFVLKKLGSNRNAQDAFWWNKNPQHLDTPVNRFISNFYAGEFTKKIKKDEEYKYKISTAIAEHLMGTIVNFEQLPEDAPKNRKMGLLYPSIGAWGNMDNLVLYPETVEQALKFVSVEYIRIDEIKDQQFRISRIDFANNISTSGEIEWKGRLPQWELKSQGDTLNFTDENGRWVARLPDGTLVDPS